MELMAGKNINAPRSPVPSAKKGRGQRPVFNMKPLNQFIEYQYFKMEAIQNVKILLQQGDWLIKLDLHLKDAYFCIPIQESLMLMAEVYVGRSVIPI